MGQAAGHGGGDGGGRRARAAGDPGRRRSAARLLAGGALLSRAAAAARDRDTRRRAGSRGAPSSSRARRGWRRRRRARSPPRAARCSACRATAAHLEALAAEIEAAGGTMRLARRRPPARGRGRGGVRGLRRAGAGGSTPCTAPRASAGRRFGDGPAPRGDARGLGDGPRDERHEPVPRRARRDPPDARPGAGRRRARAGRSC